MKPTIEQIVEIIYATMPLSRRDVVVECSEKINALYEVKNNDLTKDYLISKGWQLNESETTYQWDSPTYRLQLDGGDDSSRMGGTFFDGYRYIYELIFRQSDHLVDLIQHSLGGFTGDAHEKQYLFHGIINTENDFNFIWDLVKFKPYVK